MVEAGSNADVRDRLLQWRAQDGQQAREPVRALPLQIILAVRQVSEVHFDAWQISAQQRPDGGDILRGRVELYGKSGAHELAVATGRS